MALEVKDDIETGRGGYLFTYAQIVFNQARRYIFLHDPPKDYQVWMMFTQRSQLDAEKLECRILSVVSTALFLEAYIYDYAARKESGNFAEKYLDKLDPVSKWVVIPRLFSPPGLDQSSEIFERLRNLFKLRNELIHHKTKPGGSVWLPPEFPDESAPLNCLNLMCEVLEDLVKCDPNEEFAKRVLRHVSSWVTYAQKDSRFYPIMWEA